MNGLVLRPACNSTPAIRMFAAENVFGAPLCASLHKRLTRTLEVLVAHCCVLQVKSGTRQKRKTTGGVKSDEKSLIKV